MADQNTLRQGGPLHTAAEFVLGLLPGSGEVLSMRDAVQASGDTVRDLKRGAWARAGLNLAETALGAAGTLPVVGVLGRAGSKALRAAEDLLPEAPKLLQADMMADEFPLSEVKQGASLSGLHESTPLAGPKAQWHPEDVGKTTYKDRGSLMPDPTVPTTEESKIEKIIERAALMGENPYEALAKATGQLTAAPIREALEAKGLAGLAPWYGSAPLPNEAEILARGHTPFELYHGTRAEFSEFDPGRSTEIGFHMGTMEQAASRVSGGEGGNIQPLRPRISNPVFIDHDLGLWSPLNVATALNAEGIFDDRLVQNVVALEGSNPQLAKKFVENKLQELGYDSIVYPNFVEGSGPSVIVLAPENIRGRFAQFDPAKATSRDTLASIVGAGLLGAGTASALSSEENP